MRLCGVLKIAKKSPSRGTITLGWVALELLEKMRGDSPKSTFVEELLREEAERRERAVFYEEANQAYTTKVCEETLRVHGEFPVDEA